MNDTLTSSSCYWYMLTAGNSVPSVMENSIDNKYKRPDYIQT